MKTSCSSVLLHAAGAQSIGEMIDLAAEAGYDGIMFECGPGGGFIAERFAFRTSGELARYAVGREVEIQCINSTSLLTCDTADGGEALRRDVCIAHALACPLVAFTAPGVGGKGAFEREYGKVIEIVRDALECAGELDICLGLTPAVETIVVNLDQAIDLLDDIDRENLGLVYPPGYLARSHGEGVQEAVQLLQDSLLMTCLEGVGADDLTDGVFDEALNALRAAAFPEYVCDCGPAGGASLTSSRERLSARARHLRAWNSHADAQGD
jgi:sugar phosphate isomerase/epimerase